MEVSDETREEVCGVYGDDDNDAVDDVDDIRLLVVAVVVDWCGVSGDVDLYVVGVVGVVGVVLWLLLWLFVV